MESLLSSSKVCELLAISPTTLWRRVKAGIVPPPRKSSPNGHNRWLRSEIDDVIQSLPVADAYKDVDSNNDGPLAA